MTSPYASKRLRNWCFTWNNYDRLPTETDFGATFRSAVFQEEIGVTGTPHLQGYVEFNASTRFGAVKAMLPAAHWEPRKGNRDQAIRYCIKEDTRKPGASPVYLGAEMALKATNQGNRTDLQACFDDLRSGMPEKELIIKHLPVCAKYDRFLTKCRLLFGPKRDGKPEVYYIYGEPGVGKTTYAKTLVSKDSDDVYWKDAGSKWFDGYTGQPDVIFDDFGPSWMPWLKLMKILDGNPENVEVKNGMHQFLAKKIIMTSNYIPTELYNKDEHKRPLDAFLRRIEHYVVFDKDGRYTDHGCPLVYFGYTPVVHAKKGTVTENNEDYSTSEFNPPFEE